MCLVSKSIVIPLSTDYLGKGGCLIAGYEGTVLWESVLHMHRRVELLSAVGAGREKTSARWLPITCTEYTRVCTRVGSSGNRLSQTLLIQFKELLVWSLLILETSPSFL